MGRYNTFEPGYPPRDLIRDEFYGPNHDRIPTPVTATGLVDTVRLIKAVNNTLHTSYEWPTKPDDHHLYWPRRWYPDLSQAEHTVNPHTFRNIAINRIDLPRSFHNHLHDVILPAPVPSDETMHDVIAAHDCIRRMYSAARRAQQLLRIPEMSDREVDIELEELFDVYQEAYDELLASPPEFHFIDTFSDAVHDSYDLLTPKRDLGRYAMRTTISYASRYIRQPRRGGGEPKAA